MKLIRRVRAWWPHRWPNRSDAPPWAARVTCRCGWQTTLHETWDDAYRAWEHHAGLRP